MITSFFGTKVDQTQKFLEDGTRVPITVVAVDGITVTAVKNKDDHGYWAVQLGIGMKKKAKKSELGYVKGAKLEKAPRFFREVRFDKKTADITLEQLPLIGSVIKATAVLKAGDRVDVTGISKGKGFAGGVKSHQFRGGPRTHGQADRERAPGSIGQTTTPGRVYKGKRMAGHMGVDKTTIKNLTVIEVNDSSILIKGLIPGPRSSLVVIAKVGENKKFVPLIKLATEEIEAPVATA